MINFRDWRSQFVISNFIKVQIMIQICYLAGIKENYLYGRWPI